MFSWKNWNRSRGLKRRRLRRTYGKNFMTLELRVLRLKRNLSSSYSSNCLCCLGKKKRIWIKFPVKKQTSRRRRDHKSFLAAVVFLQCFLAEESSKEGLIWVFISLSFVSMQRKSIFLCILSEKKTCLERQTQTGRLVMQPLLCIPREFSTKTVMSSSKAFLIIFVLLSLLFQRKKMKSWWRRNTRESRMQLEIACEFFASSFHSCFPSSFLLNSKRRECWWDAKDVFPHTHTFPLLVSFCCTVSYALSVTRSKNQQQRRCNASKVTLFLFVQKRKFSSLLSW